MTASTPSPENPDRPSSSSSSSSASPTPDRRKSKPEPQPDLAIDPDLENPDPFATAPSGPRLAGRPLLGWLVAVFVLNLALSLGLAWQSGAFSADLFGHPDEAAHYVTGLAIHDYLFAGGVPGHPLRFLEEYYEHYPKVALGHYPPGFYGVESVWMLIRGTHWHGVIELLAAFSAGLAVLVFFLTTRVTNPVFGLITSLLFTALPLQQRYVSLLMSDHFLSLLIILAALAFGVYAETTRWRDVLAFAVLAAAAILTKASGVVLALVPPLVILVTGKWGLLRRPSLWVSGILVGLLTAPWFLLTAGITEEGMTAYTAAYHLEALGFYLARLLHNFGIVFLLFTLAGFVFIPRLLLQNFGRIPGPWAVVLGLPLLILSLYVILPTGLDDRYWLPALPSFFVAAAAGVHFLARLLANRMTRDDDDAARPTNADAAGPAYPIIAPILGLVLVGFTGWSIFRIPPKQIHGIDTAISELVESGKLPLAPEAPATDDDGPARVLIISDAGGEGAFVAGIAWRDSTQRRVQVIRATKAVAETDWLATDVEQLATNEIEMRRLLEDLDLDLIALDQSVPPAARLPYHDLAARTLAGADDDPQTLPLIHETPITRRTGVRGVKDSEEPVMRFYRPRGE